MGCGASTGNEVKVPQMPTKQSEIAEQSDQIQSKYIRKQLLGKGTYGSVYRCIEIPSNKQFAMKVIKINSRTLDEAKRQIQLLKNQISLLKKISHPNIVKYYSFSVTNDLQEVEIVLQLVRNGTLKEYIQSNGPIPEGQTSRISKNILEALAYLHEMKLIHRDLKCANILLTKDSIPKLTDFGTAKMIVDKDQDNIAKLSASLKGTPYYMAPQVLKRTGHNYSADIWSFGCLVIEMLSGKAPWTGISTNFSEIINYISSGVHPPFPPNISKECNFFLESCLDPIPNQRLKAHELLKHRFIDRNTLAIRNNREESSLQNKQISKKNLHYGIDNIEFELQNFEHQRKHIGQSREVIRNELSEKEESSYRPSKSKKATNMQRRESSGENNLLIDPHRDKEKPSTKNSTKYHQAIERLEKLQDQISEVSVENQERPKDYYVVKKALANLKRNKKSKTGAKTSASIKNTQENLLSMSNSQNISVSNELQLRSNTEMTHQQEVINTAISKAERDQYIEQQKVLQKQRNDEKRKWEEQLKEGAQFLKKQLSSRYMYAGR